MHNRGRGAASGTSQTESFRARGNLAIAVIVEIFTATYVWASLFQGGSKNILTSVVVACAISAANYASFIKPKVTFNRQGIRVFNPLSDDFVAWRDIQIIDARWCMTITTQERDIFVYGAPAPGRHRVRNIHESEMRGITGGETGYLRPARSPKSDSGAAVHIALFWQEASKPYDTSISGWHRSAYLPLYIASGAIMLAILINLV